MVKHLKDVFEKVIKELKLGGVAKSRYWQS